MIQNLVLHLKLTRFMTLIQHQNLILNLIQCLIMNRVLIETPIKSLNLSPILSGSVCGLDSQSKDSRFILSLILNLCLIFIRYWIWFRIRVQCLLFDSESISCLFSWPSVILPEHYNEYEFTCVCVCVFCSVCQVYEGLKPSDKYEKTLDYRYESWFETIFQSTLYSNPYCSRCSTVWCELWWLWCRWPARHDQWWECKFIAEGIIDQGNVTSQLIRLAV